jgi:hypothetical protein
LLCAYTDLAACVLTSVVAAASASDPICWKLTSDLLRKLPRGWSTAKTGQGEGSVWKVVADDTAPSKSGFVLAQAAKSPRPMFNLCVMQEGSFKDVELRVAFKAVKGEVDQCGGFVWRYQDANNYYVARMNPLEENYRLYQVVAGKRTQLQTKEGLNVPTGSWRTLRVKHVAMRRADTFRQFPSERPRQVTTAARHRKRRLR